MMSVRKRQDKDNADAVTSAQHRKTARTHREVKYDIDEHLLAAAAEHKDAPSGDTRGDRGNIAILFFLYLLQGIPLGLTAAIPMLLQNRGASYKQQAEFSFAHWPFSLKLLWAPIVDSLYWSKFGRRKSWLIPTQYLIGIFMLILQGQVNKWLGGEGEHNLPNVPILTLIFFSLNFLAATQDIAVDGWALTMLKRENVGHASTCNSVGQTAGYFLGYVLFIALESKDFCNTYLRTVPEDEGLITLPGFLWFWGIIFMVTTTLVAIFKRENEHCDNNHRYTSLEDPELNIKDSYFQLFSIIKMKPILLLSVILLTVKIAFAACDAVTSLKLIDDGVPKDKMALLAVPLVPLQIILPLIISKYTAGNRPMEVYIKAIPYRLTFTVLIALLTWFTPMLITRDHVPTYYYVLLLGIYAFYQITLYSMFVAVMAFFARISDPKIGGTYMTLLNTLCNLGGNWPTTLVLWLVDVLTWRECRNPGPEVLGMNNTCSSPLEKEACTTSGGECNILIDGYYIECLICLIYGLLWYHWGSKKIRYLQQLPMKSWHVVRQTLR